MLTFTFIFTMVALVVIAAVIVWEMTIRSPRYAYRTRSLRGRGWSSACPAATNAEIRDFLSVFANAFAKRENEHVKFVPSDTLSNAYRKLRPGRITPDTQEFEALARELNRHYGLAFDSYRASGITLGALLDLSLATAKQAREARHGLLAH